MNLHGYVYINIGQSTGYGTLGDGSGQQGERDLRDGCPAIPVILIIAAVMTLSGCASGPAPPANITATPEAIGPVPVPTPVPLRSGSLFDTDGLQWFEYKVAGSKPAISSVRFEYTTTAINGITVRDDRITLAMANPDMQVILDKYYDLASNAQVGTRTKTVSTGASLSDLGLQSGDLYKSYDMAGNYEAGNWPLMATGTGTISIDGKTYSCTKYSIGDGGGHGTAWASGDVPVPARIESGSADGGITTWELAGWG